MLDVAVIDDPGAAIAALDPIKARLLAELSAPASAATLAARVGVARQKVNYHLRALEALKLVEAVEERYWGGLTERLMIATAASYVVSPAALGPIAADPARNNDRVSASYLIALAARIVREVGSLWHRARSADKRLATLSIDTVICFKSPADRMAFTNDLGRAIAGLAARRSSFQGPRAGLERHGDGPREHRVVHEDDDRRARRRRLMAQLSLTAADAGERRTTASRPEALSGVIERVLQQPHERVLEMRHAAARASAGQQKWLAWLDERFAPSLA